MRPAGVVAACALLGAAVAAPAAEVKCRQVTMKDGRVYAGRVVRAGGATIIKTADRHVYVSGAFVAKNEAIEGYEERPAYAFHAEAAAGEKKGKIAAVVQNVRWGRLDPSGKVTVKLTDPKLGEVSSAMVITRITPTLVRLEGVEYEHAWSFPLRAFGGVAVRLVLGQVDAKDAASVRKAVRFFRLAGDFSRASAYLARLADAGADEKVIRAERAELQAAQLRQTLRRARMLRAAPRHEEAAKLVNALGAPAGLTRSHAALVGEAEAAAHALAGDIAAVYEARKLLSERGLGVDGLTLGRARRLVAALRPRAGGKRPEVSSRHVPVLAEKWAEPLAQMAVTDKLVAESAALADAAGEFFARGHPLNADAPAEMFRTRRIPEELKRSIFRYARRYPADEKPQTWRKVEFKHPRTNEEYHYYVQLPSNYDPRRPTPAMVSLHGQTSAADSVRRIWGRHADRWGMILIAPEYIYGRKWGYHFSVQEHEAVLGALWHAAGRYNIDEDRVFLQGHSQGGHACWDVGAAHAGRFAGVVPIIGAPLMKAGYPNFHDVAAYSVDGSLDGAAPAMNRGWASAVMRTKCDATYVELVGRGHEGFSEEYEAIGRWLRRRRRPPGPEQITLIGFRGVDCRRAWVRVRGVRKDLPDRMLRRAVNPVRVIARCRNNTITATVTNVTKIQFFLSADLIDFSKPVTIYVNGKRRLRRFFRPDWALALSESLRRRDRQRIFLGEATVVP